MTIKKKSLTKAIYEWKHATNQNLYNFAYNMGTSSKPESTNGCTTFNHKK